MLPSGSRAVLNSIRSVNRALFLSVLPVTLLCCQVAQELYWTPSYLLAERSFYLFCLWHSYAAKWLKSCTELHLTCYPSALSICFACDTLMLPSGSRAVLNSIWSVSRALFLSVLPVTLLCCQVAQELYWTPSDLLAERSFYLFCLWHSYAAKWLKSCTELHLIC